ncbi:SGNH/GDSL hydrolase family protein [Streptomyces sp. TLI_171]|uniref:SGNH/GDSL hydrolase family protein n=1 Tax=Streptomyces sp. TLI_171 TaxID=1938859 RepID=UPI000C1761BD|nr:SGNH/GDSL hydrolase family protein [Streptomyces sp. TLI_171]RKE22892.1 lysophospholipase L1-like esterase [Streptomyces sp. TLI_171]
MTVRFAALGDSLTEGVGDPVPGGWRGWAALLAPSLSPDTVEFRNLANSGALSRDLLVSQLPTALALRPQYAAVLVGGNDTLRASFDLDLTARHLAATLSSLTSAGIVPLTACLPDPGRLLGLPAPLARPLARRMRGVNAVVHGLSEHYGAVHQHLVDLPWTEDRALLSVDRLHPSATGHQMIARGFHALLAGAGRPVGAPPAELAADAPRPGADLWWMLTQGTRWVAARSTDLLPGLVALAAVEARHLLRGSTRRLDQADARATAEILARLTATVPRPRSAPPKPVEPTAGEAAAAVADATAEDTATSTPTGG